MRADIKRVCEDICKENGYRLEIVAGELLSWDGGSGVRVCAAEEGGYRRRPKAASEFIAGDGEVAAIERCLCGLNAIINP